jgi:hypothetical protein
MQTRLVKDWWGTFTLAENALMSWHVGERVIAIQRRANEYRVWDVQAAIDTKANPTVDVTSADSLLSFSGCDPNFVSLAEFEPQRFLTQQTSQSLRVKPMMPDRAVVIKPRIPISILPKESISLYAHIPLWSAFFHIEKEGEREKSIVDIPIARPSDSWFGSSTMVGELCYAIDSDAYTDKSTIPHSLFFAVTQIDIDNQSDSPLLVRRIKVPTTNLCLYQETAGQLYSDNLVVINEDEKSKPIFKVVKKEVGEQEDELMQLSPAREELDLNVFFASIKGFIE